jgi:hypothetical protein
MLLLILMEMLYLQRIVQRLYTLHYNLISPRPNLTTLSVAREF